MRQHASVMAQLQDFKAWARSGSEPISLLDYIGFVATPDLLFGFAELFWPDLVVHDGMRFLASGFSKAAYEEWRREGTSPKESQRMMNHIHVSTLLQGQPLTDEVALEAARVIAAIWSRTLGPEGLVSEALGSNFHDAAVTFYDVPQRASARRSPG